jgi:tetratricopeptide (TPR) repeat protein
VRPQCTGRRRGPCKSRLLDIASSQHPEYNSAGGFEALQSTTAKAVAHFKDDMGILDLFGQNEDLDPLAPRAPTEYEKRVQLVADYVAKVERGEPVESAPYNRFILNRGEREILNVNKVPYWQELVVTKGGGFAGVGIGPVMTGQFYQGGQEMRLSRVDIGDFLITNQGVYFGGAIRTFNIAYSTVTRIREHADPMSENSNGALYGFGLFQNAGEFIFETGPGFDEPVTRLVTTLLRRSRSEGSSSEGGIRLAQPVENRGITYDNKGNYDRAIQNLDEAIRLNPNNAKAFADRGADYNKKGDYDRAIQDLNQAIRLNPSNDNAFYNRARAYDNKGDYNRAIQDLDDAIRLNPNNADAFADRGTDYNNKGDYDRAIQDLNQAIRLDPSNADFFNNRGMVYNNKGNYDRAIQDLDEAIRLNPRHSLAINNRAIIYKEQTA